MTDETKMTLEEKVTRIRNEAEAPRLNRINGHFRNKFADLGEVKRVIEPLLAKYEVSAGFRCYFSEGSGEVLQLTVSSKSELMTSEMLLRCTDPQKRGSEMTYGRRYLWNAFWNLVADEDDDAEAAHGRVSPPQTIQKKAPAKAAPAAASGGVAEAKQAFAAAAKKTGAKTSDDLKVAFGAMAAVMFPGKKTEQLTAADIMAMAKAQEAGE